MSQEIPEGRLYQAIRDLVRQLQAAVGVDADGNTWQALVRRSSKEGGLPIADTLPTATERRNAFWYLWEQLEQGQGSTWEGCPPCILETVSALEIWIEMSQEDDVIPMSALSITLPGSMQQMPTIIEWWRRNGPPGRAECISGLVNAVECARRR